MTRDEILEELSRRGQDTSGAFGMTDEGLAKWLAAIGGSPAPDALPPCDVPGEPCSDPIPCNPAVRLNAAGEQYVPPYPARRRLERSELPRPTAQRQVPASIFEQPPVLFSMTDAQRAEIEAAFDAAVTGAFASWVRSTQAPVRRCPCCGGPC